MQNTADQVAIVGAGQMGTVMALILAERGARVRLWGGTRESIELMRVTRENVRYLPGVKIPDRISFTDDPKAVMLGAELVISAIPCQHLRSVWEQFRGSVNKDIPIASVSKGIEVETLMRPSQIIQDVLGPNPVASLSGPNIATELAQRLPATMVAACEDTDTAEWIQRSVTTPWLRVYTNPDLIGVEMAGALKNVIALAAGIVDGLKAGDNAKAALITRGLAEISRLAMEMGARRETFAGLAGLGDLITTCISPSGRNRSAGAAIGSGRPVERVIREATSVIEGIPTTRGVITLAKRFDIEMPITEAVYQVLFEGKDVIAALTDLMSRGLREED